MFPWQRTTRQSVVQSTVPSTPPNPSGASVDPSAQPAAASAKPTAASLATDGVDRLTLAQTIAAHLHLPSETSQPSVNRDSGTALTNSALSTPNGKPVAPGQNSGDSTASSGSDGSSKQGDSGSGSSNSNVAGSANHKDATMPVVDAANGSAQVASPTADPALHAAIDARSQSQATVPDNAVSTSSQPSTTHQPTSGIEQPLATALPTSLSDMVQASRLYQHVGGAEMHIAMDTDLLGAIDVRAMVHQSTFTATIGVQRSDVQSLLTSHSPALQQSLYEHNLHVAEVSILVCSIGSGSSQGNNQFKIADSGRGLTHQSQVSDRSPHQVVIRKRKYSDNG